METWQTKKRANFPELKRGDTGKKTHTDKHKQTAVGVLFQELECSWREYDLLEADVTLAKSNLLEQLEALGSPQVAHTHTHSYFTQWLTLNRIFGCVSLCVFRQSLQVSGTFRSRKSCGGSRMWWRRCPRTNPSGAQIAVRPSLSTSTSHILTFLLACVWRLTCVWCLGYDFMVLNSSCKHATVSLFEQNQILILPEV